MMYAEHELVVLRRDIDDHGLRAGDIGTVVGLYAEGGLEVEFSAPGGDTVAVLTMPASDVRPLARREILHVRDMDRMAG